MEKITITKKQLKVFQLYFKGLTQIEISEKLNCSQSYVSKTLKLVCERLGIKLRNSVLHYYRSDIEKRKRYDRILSGIQKENRKEILDLINQLYKLNLMNLNKLKIKVS